MKTVCIHNSGIKWNKSHCSENVQVLLAIEIQKLWAIYWKKDSELESSHMTQIQNHTGGKGGFKSRGSGRSSLL